MQHNVTTQYRAFIKDEIEADIGVHIGLTNVNITLKGWFDQNKVEVKIILLPSLVYKIQNAKLTRIFENVELSNTIIWPRPYSNN